ncbi:unnamed protein product [Peronospora belbahrii]|uniref:Peptidase M13 N-terminal domain-containing protein n=1 Tax=Peronospora belbahrii TaxID=622444 RepID=A0AAU9KYP6_9STRA|nr:unnamed protein product [Peronospora belbahrii]
MSEYFARVRVDNPKAQLASQLVAQLQSSMRKNLEQVDWLDGPTRQAALEKLGNMTTLVGYSHSTEQYPIVLHGDASLAVNMRIIFTYKFNYSMARIAEKNYAPDGKLQNWWSPDAAKASSQRADCFVKQYDSYAVTSATDKNKVLDHVNGELTLNANIADNGGIKLSFDAYQIFMADQAKDLGKGSKARATGFTIPTSQAAY